jgi:hypothetical protein
MQVSTLKNNSFETIVKITTCQESFLGRGRFRIEGILFPVFSGTYWKRYSAGPKQAGRI